MSKAKEVVVITGASAGVGRATARLFGERDACVGLIARSRRRLEAAKSLEKNRAVVLFTGQRLARASLRPCV